jgi:flagellar assembly protein FliH
MDNSELAVLSRWHTPSLLASGKKQALDPEIIRREAEAEGYAKGLESGRAEMQLRLDRLQQVLGMFERPLADLDRELLQQLVELSMAAASAVVQQELKTDPAIIANLVRQALTFLDAASAKPPRIFLNPLDVPLVQEQLANWHSEAQWSVVPDANLHRGHCLVSSGNALVDGGPGARLEAILAQMLQAGLDE